MNLPEKGEYLAGKDWFCLKNKTNQNQKKKKKAGVLWYHENWYVSFQHGFNLTLCGNNDPRIVKGGDFDSFLDPIYTPAS